MSEVETAPPTNSYWPIGLLGLGGILTVAWVAALGWMAWDVLAWAWN